MAAMDMLISHVMKSLPEGTLEQITTVAKTVATFDDRLQSVEKTLARIEKTLSEIASNQIRQGIQIGATVQGIGLLVKPKDE